MGDQYKRGVPLEIPYSSCKKVSFGTRKEAKAKIKRQVSKGFKKATVYKCPYCLFFHLTSLTSEKRSTARGNGVVKKII